MIQFKTEKAFQRVVERECRNYGWDFYHIQDSRKVSSKCGKGFPDLVIVRPPCIMFVELKLEYNSPTKDQYRWMRKLRACNQAAFVLKPERLPAFIETLKNSYTEIIHNG